VEQIVSVNPSKLVKQVDFTSVGTEEAKAKASSSNIYGVNIRDEDLIERLEKYSIEDVVEVKISRFLDQVGSFQLENMHELIISKVERPLLVQILRRVGGNQVQAAKILGINRNTLRKKIKLYGI
jgi:DNA-binding protein Fis